VQNDFIAISVTSYPEENYVFNTEYKKAGLTGVKNTMRVKMGDLLFQKGLISQHQLAEALEVQKVNPRNWSILMSWLV
jgi:hypothetical protein